jgi:hypothetical protein
MMSKIMNDCPSDDPNMTYGGVKVESCIVFGFNVKMT